MAITRGDLVEATTATGEVVRMRALGALVSGRDFPVIWVCTEAEWDRALADGDEPDGIPWPSEYLHEMANA